MSEAFFSFHAVKL